MKIKEVTERHENTPSTIHLIAVAISSVSNSPVHSGWSLSCNTSTLANSSDELDRPTTLQ